MKETVWISIYYTTHIYIVITLISSIRVFCSVVIVVVVVVVVVVVIIIVVYIWCTSSRNSL